MSLIQRLEQLTGPDREVDAEIYRLIRGDKRPQGFWYFSGLREKGEAPETTWIEWSKRNSPHYTSSIDAALKLVPDGWEWLRESPETMCVYLPKHEDDKSWAIHITGAHKSPAIALCIAALKARGIK